MAECYITRRGVVDSHKEQPKVLFEGFADNYVFADCLTGLSSCCAPISSTINLNKVIDATTDDIYGMNLLKSWSIDENTELSPRIDSMIYSTNETIDLTGYNAICIDLYGFCDYESSTNRLGAYFRIDRPETSIESGVPYDWTGWDNMYIYYRQRGRYFYDISQITGNHYLCFGIYHGTYSTGYTNGIRVYKITLM